MKGNFVLNQKPRPDLGINWAGRRILPGESYAGTALFTDPDCPEVLGGTNGKRRKIVSVAKRKNMKQAGWAGHYWAKIKGDPVKMAEHLRKMKEGRDRHRAEVAAKKLGKQGEQI